MQRGIEFCAKITVLVYVSQCERVCMCVQDSSGGSTHTHARLHINLYVCVYVCIVGEPVYLPPLRSLCRSSSPCSLLILLCFCCCCTFVFLPSLWPPVCALLLLFCFLRGPSLSLSRSVCVPRLCLLVSSCPTTDCEKYF